jgi:hypothetical protein
LTLVLAVLILAAFVLAILATGAELLLGVLLALLDLVAELATVQNDRANLGRRRGRPGLLAGKHGVDSDRVVH